MKINKILPVYILLFAVTFFYCRSINGQRLQSKSPSFIYFKSARGPYWTGSQLDSFLLSKTNKRYKIISRITGSEKKGDTLLYSVNLIMDPEPTDENDQFLAGQKLPKFDLKDINGNEISSESLKGKPVVINFWFASCGPCIQEMPALNQLKEKYKDSDVVFLAITFENNITVENFQKKHHFTYTAVPNANTYCNHITGIYPVTLFVNRNGIIQFADHLMPSFYDPASYKINSDLDPTGFEKNVDAILKN
ncbi:MAG: TlpA disulfide reductase family protein [Ginsengibacter sp.]